MLDRIDVEMGFTTFTRFEFGGFGGKMEKGDVAFRVCSVHWLISRMLRTLADELHKSLEKGRRDKNEISTKMR